MKLEVYSEGSDPRSYRVNVPIDDLERLGNLASAAGTDIAGVLQAMLNDGVGFAMGILEADKPEILELIKTMVVPPAPAGPVLPDEMPDAVRDAFSMMPWNSARIARVFREAGYTIKTRCEDEQAFVLWWALRLALQHGDKWREVGTEELKALPPLKSDGKN